MTIGIIEVNLVGARGLKDTDFLGNVNLNSTQPLIFSKRWHLALGKHFTSSVGGLSVFVVLFLHMTTEYGRISKKPLKS